MLYPLGRLSVQETHRAVLWKERRRWAEVRGQMMSLLCEVVLADTNLHLIFFTHPPFCLHHTFLSRIPLSPSPYTSL